MPKKTPIFTKSFIAVALINLLIMTAYYMLFIISAPYATATFAASPSTAGLVAGLMILGAIAGRFATGHLITLFSCRTMLISGLAIYTASMALYLVAGSLPALCMVRFLSGIGVGCTGNATSTLVADIVPPSRRGLGISYFSLSTIVALAMGPFCGLFLILRVSFETIFIICILAGAASLIVVYAMNLQNVVIEEKAQTSLLSIHNYLEVQVLPFSLVVLITGLCWGSVQAFIANYSEYRNLVWAASMFFLVYAVVVFISRPITGRIFDRYGENRIVPPSLFIMSCGLLMLALATSNWMMLAAGGLIGAGFGNFQSTGQSLVLKMVNSARYPHATSTFFIMLDFGVGLGPYLLGHLQPMLGYGGLYAVSAAISFLAIPVYYLLRWNRKKSAGAS